MRICHIDFLPRKGYTSLMNLGLELNRIPRGRAPKHFEVELGRDLTSEDLLELDKERGVQKPLQTLQRLTQRHRNLAQYIVMGYTNDECAALIGYTPGRISVLKSDPAFQNLIAVYSAEQRARFDGVQGKMVSALEETLDLIQDDLENKPETIPMSMKLEIVKTLGDRAGYGVETKTSGKTEVNVTIANQMEAARARVARMHSMNEKPQEPVVDATFTVEEGNKE